MGKNPYHFNSMYAYILEKRSFIRLVQPRFPNIFDYGLI